MLETPYSWFQDDGHVIINANGSRIWRTLTPKLPGTETDRLNADEYLEMGQRLTSQNGKFRLIFQGDHNLCLYTDGFVGPLWSRVSEGRDQHPSQVIMRADDDLWYGEAGQREWTSTTRRKKGNGDAYLKLEDNGTLTIRSDGLTIWSSHEQKSPVDPWEPVVSFRLRRDIPLLTLIARRRKCCEVVASSRQASTYQSRARSSRRTATSKRGLPSKETLAYSAKWTRASCNTCGQARLQTNGFRKCRFHGLARSLFMVLMRRSIGSRELRILKAMPN